MNVLDKSKRNSRKKFNDYKIDGDTTIIYIKRNNGEIFETLIDTENLQKLIDFAYTWSVAWKPKIKGYYAQATIDVIKEDGKIKKTTIALHRFVTNAQRGDYVDHFNHDSLDNRKHNIRVITNKRNIWNRKGANCNNKTSGYRNITWDKKADKWLVQLWDGKTNHRIGHYDDLEEAKEIADKNRDKFKKNSIEVCGEWRG